MNNKVKLGLTLFILGLTGILSMLTATISLEGLPEEVTNKFSPEEIRLLSLINPTVLLLIAVLIGTFLYQKVALTVPTISSILKIEQPETSFVNQLKFGIILGLFAGVLIVILALIFQSSMPQELIDIRNKIKLTPIARLLYGGLTEELLMRFGFMTLFIWIIFKITKNLNNRTYWTGIILSAILFALGHFPVVFYAVSNPTVTLLSYVLIANSTAGIIFGWLYWKKGLEAAFIGHMFAHVAMMAGEQIFQLQ